MVVFLLVGLGLSDNLALGAHPEELKSIVFKTVDSSSSSGVAAKVEETSPVGLVFRLGEPSARDGFVSFQEGGDINATFNEFHSINSVGGSKGIQDGLRIVVGRDIEDN